VSCVSLCVGSSSPKAMMDKLDNGVAKSKGADPSFLTSPLPELAYSVCSKDECEVRRSFCCVGQKIARVRWGEVMAVIVSVTRGVLARFFSPTSSPLMPLIWIGDIGAILAVSIDPIRRRTTLSASRRLDLICR
jgi:hypothetical protein